MLLVWIAGLTLVAMAAIYLWYRTQVASRAHELEPLLRMQVQRRPDRSDRLPEFTEDTAPAVLSMTPEWEPPTKPTLRR
jgi:hypothetical protein